MRFPSRMERARRLRRDFRFYRAIRGEGGPRVTAWKWARAFGAQLDRIAALEALANALNDLVRTDGSPHEISGEVVRMIAPYTGSLDFQMAVEADIASLPEVGQ